MSYDLRLFHVAEGADAKLTYEQLLDQEEAELVQDKDWLKRPIPESARAEMRRLADALRSWRPGFLEFEPKSPLPWIELDEWDLQVQIHICEGSASITMPYFREHAREMMLCATGCIRILEAAAGFGAYDPQLGRVVTEEDLQEMVAQYRGMDKHREGFLAHGSQPSSPARKPWWKMW